MNIDEQAVVFECAGAPLVGVLAKPAGAARAGLVIIVGGPQYRAGSHRQFTLLARRLAREDVAVLRFDYRAMGDSDGPKIDFENTRPDIGAAIDLLISRCPEVREVALWGLCDGASAGLLYTGASADARVTGIVLINPWVRSDATLARTQVKHYYGQRLLQAEFWIKLLRGGVGVGGALRELAGKLRLSAGRARVAAPGSIFQARMADALRRYDGRVLLILSGADFTAKEFVEYAGADAAWSGLLQRANLRRLDIPAADHTFSTAAWRSQVEEATLAWLVDADGRR